MKLYNVDKMSVSFNPNPIGEFMVKYFAIVYYLSCGKVLIRYHLHRETNINNFCRLPDALWLEEAKLNAVPSALPTFYTHSLRYHFN